MSGSFVPGSHHSALVALKQLALQLYRFAVVATIVWLIRDVAVRQRIQGDSPVTAAEVVSLIPTAASLRADDSARDGLFVLDRTGRELGYVVRTQPACRDILGYAGTTDALVVLDRDWKIIGLKIHASEDTDTYVRDITLDRRFLKKWNGLTWDNAAQLDLKAAGIEGVSGATMTSMAIAQSVKARLKLSRDEIAAATPLRFAWRDYALLVVLAAAALMVPFTTGKPFYCHQICPHGAAQELISHFRPARFQITLSGPVIRGLENFPFALLGLTLVVALTAIPLDLADLEPFAAYILRSAGLATLTVAAVGLIAAFFVPQAYCRFGCPTGALLNFVRARGPADRFSLRDAVSLVLLGLAALLNWKYLAVILWIKGLA